MSSLFCKAWSRRFVLEKFSITEHCSNLFPISGADEVTGQSGTTAMHVVTVSVVLIIGEYFMGATEKLILQKSGLRKF